MKYKLVSSIAIAFMLQGCETLSTRPSPVVGPTPLQIAACPPLTPLDGDTFGETTRKLIEVASIYRECRAAHNHTD